MAMNSLYLLIPISLVLVLLIGGLLAWAVLTGQLENLEAEGARILDEDEDTSPRKP
jgi:cbb3-type cytochrome oxidase maturation protein